MRKAIIFRSNLLPASETFVRNQAEALTRWEPTLVGLKRTASPTSRVTDIIVDLPSKLHRKLHILTGRSRRLSRFVRASGAELIHVHFATDAWLVVKAARAAGVPIIVTVHARDVTAALNQGSFLRKMVMRYRVRYALSRASKVITVSDYIRTYALAAGAHEAQTVRLYTGTPIPEQADFQKDWDIVFVGRLVEKKGVDDLFAALRDAGDIGLRVAVAGDGPLMEHLVSEAANISAQITFLGMLEPAAALDTISRSRVLAAPSKTGTDGDIEGLPTVIVEALALGVPVVATRHSGIPEAVVDGINGRLVDEGDVGELAHALTSLLGDELEAARASAKARELATKTFDIATQSAQLELLYDQVASPRAS